MCDPWIHKTDACWSMILFRPQHADDPQSHNLCVSQFLLNLKQRIMSHIKFVFYSPKPNLTHFGQCHRCGSRSNVATPTQQACQTAVQLGTSQPKPGKTAHFIYFIILRVWAEHSTAGWPYCRNAERHTPAPEASPAHPRSIL